MIREDLKIYTLEEAKKIYPEIQINKRCKNLIGFQTGSLKVLYKTESEFIGKTKKAMWVCECQNCKNFVKRRADYLYQKRIMSCGCLNFPGYIDITNNKYGSLTAIALDHYDKNNGYIWKCKCDCENECLVSYCSLNTNRRIMCPKCSKRKAMIALGKNGSKGSQKIEYLLQNNDIKYEKEWSFSDLKDKSYLYYDFYLPDYNILIEFDGQQHYTQSIFSMFNDFEITKKHDKMKNNYAIKNNFILIRIPYWEENNITINDLLQKSKFKILKEQNGQ